MFPEQYKNRLLMNTTVHSDGCWLYNGTKSNGYGRMTIGSRSLNQYFGNFAKTEKTYHYMTKVLN